VPGIALPLPAPRETDGDFSDDEDETTIVDPRLDVRDPTRPEPED
jgi:hypothetical protein